MRLFLSVEIPDKVKENLSKAAADLPEQAVTMANPEDYHITLQFLGEVSEEDVPAVQSSMSYITQEPFSVGIVGLSYFGPGMRVVFAAVREGLEELRLIYGQMSRGLSDNGISYKADLYYEPHVTVARVKSPDAKDGIMGVVEKYRAHDFGSFSVGSVLIKASLPSPEGYVHKTLYEHKL